ncbi:monooxygenase [Actinoplanes sp. CA-054009]
MPVTLHVWRVTPRRAGSAMLRMARRRVPAGVSFAKLLGTASGFRPGDADLTRYAAVTVSPEPVRFPDWDRLAIAAARVDLIPLHSRGTWSGRTPFSPSRTESPPSLPDKSEKSDMGSGAVVRRAAERGTGPGGTAERGAGPGGMVLSLTRARLRPARALTFWRAIPPVVTELDRAPGLLAYFGMGEAPVGWQGTVSLWSDAADLARFAYRQPEHRAVIARTPTDRWYAEELFARFAVQEISGDRSVLGWLSEDVGAGGGTGR